MVLDIRSDTVGTAAPEMVDALREANKGTASSYDADELSAMVHKRYPHLFEAAVEVFAIRTGTAANARHRLAQTGWLQSNFTTLPPSTTSFPPSD